jgi:hypothetical protein
MRYILTSFSANGMGLQRGAGNAAGEHDDGEGAAGRHGRDWRKGHGAWCGSHGNNPSWALGMRPELSECEIGCLGIFFLKSFRRSKLVFA